MHLDNLRLLLGLVVCLDHGAVDALALAHDLDYLLAVSVNLLSELLDLSHEILQVAAKHASGNFYVVPLIVVQGLSSLHLVHCLLRLVQLHRCCFDLLLLRLQLSVESQVVLGHPLELLLVVLAGLLDRLNVTSKLRLFGFQGLNSLLLFLEGLLKTLFLLFLGLDVSLQSSPSPIPGFQSRLQSGQLLLEALAAPQFSLGLGSLGIEHIFEIGNLNLTLELLGLMDLHFFGELNVVLGHLLNLALQLITRLHEIITLRHQAVDGVLLVHGETCPLLNQMAQVCDLNLQVVYGLLCTLLLLVRGFYHFPRSLNLLLEILNGCLILL
mmetsp:Transcript_31859/g.74477  ORF Transcript_31859/g.74477 Transcript_31859/m.74477 type:complete len:326 (-) Transcript_31859:281-1258(-)